MRTKGPLFDPEGNGFAEAVLFLLAVGVVVAALIGLMALLDVHIWESREASPAPVTLECGEWEVVQTWNVDGGYYMEASRTCLYIQPTEETP